MILFLEYIAIWSLGIGIYLFATSFFIVPATKTKKMALALYARSNKRALFEAWFVDITEAMAKYISMNEFKRQRLEVQLNLANLPYTPEVYMARVVVQTLFPIVVFLPLYFTEQIFVVIALLIAFMIYQKEKKALSGQVSQKREEIENELHKFSGFIATNLKSSRGVREILKSYIPYASPSLQRELEITVADMHTGNYETAISRLEARVQSGMLSDICRGLVSSIRGDDVLTYFELLTHDFKQIQLQKLRKRALRIPDKIRKYSMFMLVIMVFLFITVLILNIVMGIKDIM